MVGILREYVPHNVQEEQDKAEIIKRLESGEELFCRENTSAHLIRAASGDLFTQIIHS